jgi:hypothetical protein
MVGSCEHDNGTSGSIKGVEFLQQLNYHQVLLKDSAPCSQLHVWVVLWMEILVFMIQEFKKSATGGQTPSWWTGLPLPRQGLTVSHASPTINTSALNHLWRFLLQTLVASVRVTSPNVPCSIKGPMTLPSSRKEKLCDIEFHGIDKGCPTSGTRPTS